MKRTTIDPGLAAELLGLAAAGQLRPAELVRDIVRERFGLTIEEMAELEPIHNGYRSDEGDAFEELFDV